MAEIITCPACGRKLQVPESYYGQKVQCPDCAHQFVADPHAESVQVTPPSTVPTTEVSPGRRPRDDEDEFDDDFDDMRPLRRTGVPHRAGTILALGVLSLVIFPYATIICGPLAWILGSMDLAEIRSGNMDRSGEGMVQAGRILGIISTILMVVVVLFFCVFFGFVFIARMH